MRASLFIKNAGELIVVGRGPKTKKKMGTLEIVENGAIAVLDDRIVAVGPTKELETRVECSANTRVVDVAGRVVLPGFVDPHTHLVFAGSREFELELKLSGTSYMEIKRLGGGIPYTVRQTREASFEKLVEQSKKRLDTILAYGTTTVEAKSGYGLSLVDETKILRVIKHLDGTHPVDVIPTFLGAHLVPPEYEEYPEKYLELLLQEMIPEVAKSGLAEFCDVFCEKGVFSSEEAYKILLNAKKHGLKPKIHADEFSWSGGAETAARVGATSADHLLHVSDDGIKALAEKKVVAVLLPATPFSMGLEQYANAKKMIENGVIVALATDLNTNCWTESMQFIIQLACFKMGMTPAQAINAATINAAYAIDRQQTVGSLEPGKKADIIVLNIPNHRFLCYHFGVNHVAMVIKNGQIVVDNLT